MAGEQSGPVTCWRPDPARAVPVVFDSPHSGRGFPEDFAPALPLEDLAGFEDRLVDDLLAGAPGHGIVLIAAGFPRAYIDPNRAPDDLDKAVVGDEWGGELNPSEHAARGVGLVFRSAPGGAPIYEKPLSQAEIEARIARHWRPYHAALEAALDAAAARWGRVWHVNWHSMRPVGNDQAPDSGAVRPDFVVSDRDGTSAEPGFTACMVAALRGRGHSVAINAPFKGGYIVARHGRPQEGRHSLQVEINRARYLDMETLEPSAGFADLRRTLAEVARLVADHAAAGAG